MPFPLVACGRAAIARSPEESARRRFIAMSAHYPYLTAAWPDVPAGGTGTPEWLAM